MNQPQIAFSNKAKRTGEAPISYLIALAKANPQLISFAAGLVDPQTLPGKEVQQIVHDLLDTPEGVGQVLQYSTTVGYQSLRQAIVQHIQTLESTVSNVMSITPDNVVVTTGSQQALYILADILIDPGDIVIVESPSYFVYAGALGSFGANLMAVPMDRDGMVVEELDKLLHRIEAQGQIGRVKAVYCQSYFQNPTGLTLSAARRPRLVEIVKKYSTKHRILLIEDAAYRELRYEGDDLHSLKYYDADNLYVASCYTFDKPFAAGLKVGYTILPGDLAHKLIEQKGNHDFGSSHLCQQICHRALVSGQYLSHLEIVRAGYRKKRDVMLSALKQHMPATADVQWTHPAGGLYSWLSLPMRVNTSRTGALFERCLQSGVIYVPGEYCFHAEPGGQVPQNHMRLCYAVTPIEQIEPGIKMLADAIAASLKESFD